MISDKTGMLTRYFDCVVMLTWSNWKTEPRSNRYHYASRFARHLPVIFIQPDLAKMEATFEKTEIENLVVLHVYAAYGRQQTELINKALVERGFTQPLLWVYNVFFRDFIAQKYSPLVVYHATEDYFGLDAIGADKIQNSLREVLQSVDLLVGVSAGVLSSYKKNGPYNGKTLLLENGCDFSFWKPDPNEMEQIVAQQPSRKIVFYQGGINSRLDFELLTGICKALPDWQFWICGRMEFGLIQEIRKLEQLPNLKNWGLLNIEKVRELTYQADVGIIPFVQNEIIRVSLPLKAFEYVACGLPVVSVPIPALQRYDDVFVFAENPLDFSKAITRVAETRHNEENIKKRLETAREQDYDIRFNSLLNEIDANMASQRRTDAQLNILVLYDANSLHVSTIKEHLTSFVKYSKSNVFYVSATNNAMCTIDPSIFDVMIIHYCVRLSLEDHLSPSFAKAVCQFGGYKILFIQDEYDTTETARCWIERLGIHAVFTCVPPEYVDEVYPKGRFPHLERIQTLTGFVPIGIEQHHPTPIAERQVVIGYRGRPLPFYYGDLGREKVVIAQRMKQICREKNISEDIEWTHEKRIYGDRWYPFVESSKATLGTESGSNVFDDDGNIKRSVEKAIVENPDLSYEETHARYIGAREGKIKMNQISPRVFEAVALRTALVLFEGNYSGVIQPDIHYIPLKKDFSNIEDVLAKVTNDSYLTDLTERAYKDIILSKKYSYENFIGNFDAFLSKKLVKRNGYSPWVGLLGQRLPQNVSQSAAQNKYSAVSISPLTNVELNELKNSILDSIHLEDIIRLIGIVVPRGIRKYRTQLKKRLRRYIK